MVAEIATAAHGLSMLASIFSITRSVLELMKSKKLDSKQALSEFAVSASEHDRKLLEMKGVSASILAMTTINPALLMQFEEEAADCQTKHINDRRKAKGDAVRGELADQKAKRCMCAVLKSLQKHNKGIIPEGQLKAWWDSYGCDT